MRQSRAREMFNNKFSFRNKRPLSFRRQKPFLRAQKEYTIDVYDYDINTKTYVIQLYDKYERDRALDEELETEEWEEIFIYEDEEAEDED